MHKSYTHTIYNTIDMFRLVEEEEEATHVSDEGEELFTDGLEVDEDEDV